jgi:hypothetical protein
MVMVLMIDGKQDPVKLDQELNNFLIKDKE